MATKVNETQAKIVEQVQNQLAQKDLSQQAVIILQRATQNVLTRVQQNVDAQIKEESTPIVEEFVKNVAGKMSAMTQSWHDSVKNELVVFPEGTRYIFRDGNVTTIIVEEIPQVRTIRLSSGLCTLAMPYIQFVIAFRGNSPIKMLKVSATKKPISDLDLPIGNVPLPNVSADHSVCIGSSDWPTQGNMTEMVSEIIGGFWQSVFTDNHLEIHNNFLKNNNLTLAKWQKMSSENSSFIIDKNTNLQIGATGTGTLRGLLVKDNDTKHGSLSVISNLKQEIVTAVGSVAGEIKAAMQDLDLQVENREKVHVETLQNVLKEIIVQAYSELSEFLQKQVDEERRKLTEEMQSAAQRLKSEFTKHMDAYNSNLTSKKNKNQVW